MSVSIGLEKFTGINLAAWHYKDVMGMFKSEEDMKVYAKELNDNEAEALQTVLKEQGVRWSPSPERRAGIHLSNMFGGWGGAGQFSDFFVRSFIHGHAINTSASCSGIIPGLDGSQMPAAILGYTDLLACWILPIPFRGVLNLDLKDDVNIELFTSRTSRHYHHDVEHFIQYIRPLYGMNLISTLEVREWVDNVSHEMGWSEALDQMGALDAERYALSTNWSGPNRCSEWSSDEVDKKYWELWEQRCAVCSAAEKVPEGRYSTLNYLGHIDVFLHFADEMNNGSDYGIRFY